MNLRQRTLYSVGITLVALIAVVYVCSHQFLLGSFSTLENAETERNVDRAVSALDQEVSKLHGLTADWSDWDDTYKFVKDHNQGYIDANLKDVFIDVDLLMFLDTEGKIVESRHTKRERKVAAPDSMSVWRALKFDKDSSKWAVKPQGTSGVVALPNGHVMVSILPIRPSSRIGPVRGWLVFALWLDKTAVAEISATTQLQTELVDPRTSSLDSAVLKTIHNLSTQQKAYLTATSEAEIQGYRFISDVFGQPSLILRIDEKREIYAQGAKSVDLVLKLLLLSAFILGLVNFAVIEYFALRRVFSLSEQVEDIEEGDRDDSLVVLGGKDEISKLAGRINSLLIKMRESSVQLKLKNESLNKVVDELANTNVALENAVESIARVSGEGRILTTNAAFDSMFSTSSEPLVGRQWQSMLSEASQEDSHKAIVEMTTEGRAEAELIGQRNDGREFYIENVFLPFVNEGGEVEGHYWFVKDISDRKVLESQIQHQAFHDTLTGLPNRALFLDRLGQSLSRARRKGTAVSMIYIDLDNFKVINDSWGHDAGDSLLVEVSKVLTSCIRPEDTVARLGGDEFTIILSDLDSIEEAKAVAVRIKEAFKNPVNLTHGIAYASASIGITYSVGGETNSEDMLRDADTAMYRAKALGGSSYVVFDASMNAQAVERMEIEAGLRTAVENNEFSLDFQPLVDLESERVIGIEALLRWTSTKLGVVHPESFIPVAEETGLITSIGDWVFENSFKLVKDWNDRFGALRLAVNLSGVQLKRHDIVETVSSALSKTGLDPHLLEIEITESMLMRDVNATVNRLKRLREMGITLAIDDFGTGYSSLSCLNSFPLNTVKIDRSFIAKVTDGSKYEAVVRAIVVLSKSLNFDVTAEGIERIDQLEKVAELGCNTAQGYLFFEPLTVEQMEQALSHGLLDRKPDYRKTA